MATRQQSTPAKLRGKTAGSVSRIAEPVGENVGLPRITESEFMSQVIAFAKLNLWRIAHFRPALTARGWRTAVQADGAGFPDLVLVRERVVWAELKAEGGKVRPEQAQWIDTLAEAGQEVYLWKPSDWSLVMEVLARK